MKPSFKAAARRVAKGSQNWPYDNERDGVIFYGRGVDGKELRVITRLDEKGNIYADLSEVTVLPGGKRKDLPPPKPLAEVVRTVVNRRQRGGLLTADGESVSQTDPSGKGEIMLARPQGVDRSLLVFGRTRVAEDAGRGEMTPGSLAASRELATQQPTPIQNAGRMRKLSLTLSDMEWARKFLTGSVVPAHIAAKGSQN